MEENGGIEVIDNETSMTIIKCNNKVIIKFVGTSSG